MGLKRYLMVKQVVANFISSIPAFHFFIGGTNNPSFKET